MLCRWLKTCNISLTSEQRQRALATVEVGDNLAHQMVPFAFSKDGGGEQIREATFVYVPSLIRKIRTKVSEQR